MQAKITISNDVDILSNFVYYGFNTVNPYALVVYFIFEELRVTNERFIESTTNQSAVPKTIFESNQQTVSFVTPANNATYLTLIGLQGSENTTFEIIDTGQTYNVLELIIEDNTETSTPTGTVTVSMKLEPNVTNECENQNAVIIPC